MPKESIWVVIIALGVFLGAFGYEKFTEYRLKKAMVAELQVIQQVFDDIQSDQQATAQKLRQQQQSLQLQQQARDEQRRQAEFDRTTACGINEDAGTCRCLNMNTGQRVAVPHEDCIRRARESTH